MTNNHVAVFILILGVLFLAATILFSPPSVSPPTPIVEEPKGTANMDNLRFSNTMEWNPELLAIRRLPSAQASDFAERISIMPPPANSSEETRRELDLLISYKALRTEEKVAEVKREINIHGAIIDGRPMSDYLDTKQYPVAGRVFGEALRDIGTVALILKEKYDRVRPSILRPEIDPGIEVPGHPAYPSGHSTEAHMMAFLLAEIMPEKTEIFMRDAGAIAKNREIIGVHYPSDSAAGLETARQFMELLRQDSKFQKELPRMREELRQK